MSMHRIAIEILIIMAASKLIITPLFALCRLCTPAPAMRLSDDEARPVAYAECLRQADGAR